MGGRHDLAFRGEVDFDLRIADNTSVFGIKRSRCTKKKVWKEMDNAILSTAEAAKYLGVSTATLQKWRTAASPTALPFVRISARKIGYATDVLAEFIRARRHVSTREYHASPEA
jgi:hypothetical protein